MNYKWNISLAGIALLSIAGLANAAPYAELEVDAKKTHLDEYTYTLTITNQGPILEDAVTPEGKSLKQDENIVVFGIDTGRDDIVISNITNGDSIFNGTEEMGWSGNQVVAWHLPFDNAWTLDDTLQHGKTLKVSFTTNARLEKLLTWVGGSDDDVIWVYGHDMVEDSFGIYDMDDKVYRATFLERHVHVKFHAQYGHHDH